MLRWAVNVAAWKPTPQQWQLVLSALPQETRQKCLTYRQVADQKRAVVSQVLQRACVSRLLGDPWQQVVLGRTKGSKPFYAGSSSRQDAPNFNYNVSHEVGLVDAQHTAAAHPVCTTAQATPERHRRRPSRTAALFLLPG